LSGEIYAIACAVLWATSSTLLKSQTGKVNIVWLNALRTMPALAIYWILVLATGRIGTLAALPLRAWAFLICSSVVGLVIGDLLYLQSMKLIGLSRAMPLSTTYPFFTMLLAWLFLREPLDWTIAAGATLIALGAYMLAVSRPSVAVEAVQGTARANLAGIVLAFLAAICWSSSTVMLRVGLEQADAIIANAVRMLVLVVVLLLIIVQQGELGLVKGYSLRTWGVASLAGLIGTGLGTYAFANAIQLAGAAKTSILTAAMPLFGVPLSLLLGEKPSSRTLMGTALTVAGVWLTIA
jgi:DME family drug/metabolite transporter